MIRIENAKKYFNRNKQNEIRAIDNTTLELGDKGLVAFLGHSGCGKTTLLNAIGGLDNLTSGDIYIDDEKISTKWSFKKDDIRNRNIGYIFQYYNLIEDKTVFENVEIVLRMMGLRDRKEIHERVMYVLEKIGIARYKNRPAKMLSGGERQRVGIARAIVKNPKIIIADEPTGNLDSENTIEVMNIIKAISRDRLVILVTHEKEIANFYADRIIEIVDGKAVKDYDNSHDNNLDLRMDNRIYLKDMETHESFTGDDFKINFYNDNKFPVNITVVVKDNALYIQTDGALKKGNEGIKLIDDHYKQITKDVYEKYNLDYEKMIDKEFKPKYASIFSWGGSVVEGFKKITGFSKLKKFLMVGFVLSAMFVLYSVSSIIGIRTIDEIDFMQNPKEYVKIGKQGIDGTTMYNKLKNLKEVDNIIIGNGHTNFSISIDRYVQAAGGETPWIGSIVGVSKLKKEDIKWGSLPESKDQVVVDSMLIDKLRKSQGSETKNAGLIDYKDFIGMKLSNKLFGDKVYIISGISNKGSIATYVDDDEAIKISDMAMNKNTEIGGYYRYSENPRLKIEKGSAPKAENEVIISVDKASEGYGIGSTIKNKLNGKDLKVTGIFSSDGTVNVPILISDEGSKTMLISGANEFRIVPKHSKGELLKELRDANIVGSDLYESDRAAYEEKLKTITRATVIVAIVMLIISLIEMYLMLRSSFLSRVKEVGVLRAIGLKKKDVAKLFIGEIFATTVVTAIPGIGIMYYILSKIVTLETIGTLYELNVGIAAISFVIVMIFNLVVGLIPVWATMRKTPAAILARNDVD